MDLAKTTAIRGEKHLSFMMPIFWVTCSNITKFKKTFWRWMGDLTWMGVGGGIRRGVQRGEALTSNGVEGDDDTFWCHILI